jgi:hypothetical protein
MRLRQEGLELSRHGSAESSWIPRCAMSLRGPWGRRDCDPVCLDHGFLWLGLSLWLCEPRFPCGYGAAVGWTVPVVMEPLWSIGDALTAGDSVGGVAPRSTAAVSTASSVSISVLRDAGPVQGQRGTPVQPCHHR